VKIPALKPVKRVTEPPPAEESHHDPEPERVRPELTQSDAMV
jgi:hypothetical protein